MMRPSPSTTTAPTRGFGWGRWPLAAAIAADIISLSTRSTLSSLLGMHRRGGNPPPSPISLASPQQRTAGGNGPPSASRLRREPPPPISLASLAGGRLCDPAVYLV